VGSALTKTFTVKNLGTQALVLSGPIVLPAGFSLTTGFGATTLAPGASTSFTVRLDATSPGTYSGQVSFGTNDTNNNPFTFSLSGAVTAVNIIDDSNPGYSNVGSWTRWTNGGYLGDVEEATNKTGADVSSWTFSNLLPGQYRVSVTWTPYADRATNAPYTVLDGASALGTMVVNQQVGPVGFSDAGAAWQDLGNFQIHNGSLVVQLSDAANGYVIADAVRIAWLGPLPMGPAFQVLAGGGSSSGWNHGQEELHESPIAEMHENDTHPWRGKRDDAHARHDRDDFDDRNQDWHKVPSSRKNAADRFFVHLGKSSQHNDWLTKTSEKTRAWLDDPFKWDHK
jgi:hypothetical protein